MCSLLLIAVSSGCVPDHFKIHSVFNCCAGNPGLESKDQKFDPSPKNILHSLQVSPEGAPNSSELCFHPLIPPEAVTAILDNAHNSMSGTFQKGPRGIGQLKLSRQNTIFPHAPSGLWNRAKDVTKLGWIERKAHMFVPGENKGCKCDTTTVLLHQNWTWKWRPFWNCRCVLIPLEAGCRPMWGNSLMVSLQLKDQCLSEIW